MRMILIGIIDPYAPHRYALTLKSARMRQTSHAGCARAHRFDLTSLDVNVSENRMLQAVPYSPNGTGNVQAAVIPKRDLDRYDAVARFFHWVFASGILYTSIAGYTLAQLSGGPARDFLSRLNMSIATVLILLFPLRVIWKAVRVEPRAIPDVSAAQRSVAHWTHISMYVTMFAVLASGYLMVPDGYSFFGLVEIHTPFSKGAITDALFIIHRSSCALLAALVVLHVLAVVKHRLIDRRDVLRRML
jgi:superoxide oxidase